MDWRIRQDPGFDQLFSAGPMEDITEIVLKADQDALTAGAKPGRAQSTERNRLMKQFLLSKWQTSPQAAWIASLPSDTVKVAPIFRERARRSNVGRHFTCAIDILFEDRGEAAKFKIQFVGL